MGENKQDKGGGVVGLFERLFTGHTGEGAEKYIQQRGENQVTVVIVQGIDNGVHRYWFRW